VSKKKTASLVLRERIEARILFFRGRSVKLDRDLASLLLLQNVIPSKRSLGGAVRYVFTHEGIAMLSSVLRSESALRVNIEIMRTFVRLRAMLLSHEELSRKLAALEKKYSTKFKMVFEAIKQLMEPSSVPEEKGRIGFRTRGTD
jgi:hypothetical protein